MGVKGIFIKKGINDGCLPHLKQADKVVLKLFSPPLNRNI